MAEAKAKKPVKVGSVILTVIMACVSVLYIAPIVFIAINSFKDTNYIKGSFFEMPVGDMWVGMDNFARSVSVSSYPFYKSVLYSFVITILSTILILLFTSMAAWYIARVNSVVCKIFYFLCVFSMVVPFQMVMFTLSQDATMLHLNTPWTIPVVYLGFGAGLAIFMFVGFVKSIPVEIEEAASIDGCNPVRTYFLVVFPLLKPTLISVGILEIMWIWNDYLLPTLVLDITKYKTIPMYMEAFKKSYGGNDLGAMIALILLSIIPVIAFYLACQKHIIKGVAAGAVKG